MAVRLRPRNAWEALDLGLALVRANAGRVYGVWLAAYLPVAFVVYAALWEHPVIAWVVLWWLKPLFDRIILATLSRSLFGEAPSVREILSLRASGSSARASSPRSRGAASTSRAPSTFRCTSSSARAARWAASACASSIARRAAPRCGSRSCSSGWRSS